MSFYLSEDGTYYNLHPEFVFTNPGNGDVTATICKSCYGDVSKGKIPKFSLAAGLDFGNADRIKLPTLTLAEQYVIAQGRLYVSVIKLSGRQATERQSAMKGHVITFPQSTTHIAEEIARSRIQHDNGIYPRIDDISKYIAVAFVGSRQQWDALIPTRLPNVSELQVDADKVFLWLRALKALNPRYRDIVIDNSNAMRETLNNITSNILQEVTIIDECMEENIEKVVQGLSVPNPFGTTDSREEPKSSQDNVAGNNLPLISVFMTASSAPPLNVDTPDIALLQGMRKYVNLILISLK